MEQKDLRLFCNMPILETERLILRRIVPSDLEDVYAYSSDPSVPRYLLWYPHSSRKQTAQYLKLIDKKYKKAEFYDWGVVIKSDNRLIGTCGFTSFSIENNSAEIGYVINSSYWGRGIAAEAARAVVTFGFEALRLNRIEGNFMPENHSSRRVLEKCGMRSEGIRRQAMYAKSNYIDIETCAITYSDYKTITSVE